MSDPFSDARGPFPVQPGPPPAPSQSMATWALVLSFIPCGPTYLVGAGMGIAVLIRSSRERVDYGRKKAIAAICVAVGWLVVAAVIVGLVIAFGGKPEATAADTERDSTEGYTTTGAVSVDQLLTFDCIRDALDLGDVRTVTITPCFEAHRAQVYEVFDLKGKRYPGSDEVTRTARARCLKDIPSGIRGKKGRGVDLIFLYPTNSQQFGLSKMVSCVAQFPDVQTKRITP